MNPLDELHNKAQQLKQNGIKVMSIDYILQQYERETEYYRLTPRSPSEAS